MSGEVVRHAGQSPAIPTCSPTRGASRPAAVVEANRLSPIDRDPSWAGLPPALLGRWPDDANEVLSWCHEGHPGSLSAWRTSRSELIVLEATKQGGTWSTRAATTRLSGAVVRKLRVRGSGAQASPSGIGHGGDRRGDGIREYLPSSLAGLLGDEEAKGGLVRYTDRAGVEDVVWGMTRTGGKVVALRAERRGRDLAALAGGEWTALVLEARIAAPSNEALPGRRPSRQLGA